MTPLPSPSSLRPPLALAIAFTALLPTTAFADAPGKVEASVWRSGFGVEFGTLRRPSLCEDYCDHAYGPAIAAFVGRQMGPRLAVIGEAWLFHRYALALTGGAEVSFGETLRLRASLGVMATEHDNADGGPGAGIGPAASVTLGARVAEFARVRTEVSIRATIVHSGIGTVTSLTAGYGVAW